MKAFRRRVLTSFLLVILLASTIASVLAILSSNYLISGDLHSTQQAMAENYIALAERTDIPLKDIVQYTHLEAFEASILNADDVSTLVSEKPVTITGRNTVIVHVRDQYVLIQPSGAGIIYSKATLRTLLTILMCTFFSLLLIWPATNRVLAPLLSLNDAMGKVSGGELDTQVEAPYRHILGSLVDRFNSMIASLKSIEYLRRDFVGNVSHELKAPLSSIQGYARLLQKNDLAEDKRISYAQILINETERLSYLTENLLELSRLESQQTLGKTNAFSLDEQIRYCVLSLETEWVNKNIEWELDLPATVITGREDLLNRIWTNLISNAIKFSNDGGKIIITVKKEQEICQVEVMDFGIGMPPVVAERIFEKFYQGDSARQTKGYGLGLSLVKRIIDLHHGTISVKTAEGKGCAVTVKLPAQH